MEKVKKETRGGYRRNARRPLKYGEETQRLVFQVPVSKTELISQMVQNQLKKWEVKKSEK